MSISSTFVADIAFSSLWVSPSFLGCYTTRDISVKLVGAAVVRLDTPVRTSALSARPDSVVRAHNATAPHPGAKGATNGDRRDCRAQTRRPQHRTYPRSRQRLHRH